MNSQHQRHSPKHTRTMKAASEKRPRAEFLISCWLIRAGVFLLILAALLPHSRAQSPRSEPHADQVQPFHKSADGIQFHARSDWHVSAADARRECRERLSGIVAEHFAPLLPANTGQSNVIASLFVFEDVLVHIDTETAMKPYGTLYRQCAQVTVPAEAIGRWSSGVQSKQTKKRVRQVLLLVAVIGGIFGTTWMGRKIDRLTRGYRRVPILLGTGLAWLSLTVIAWLIS